MVQWLHMVAQAVVHVHVHVHRHPSCAMALATVLSKAACMTSLMCGVVFTS